MIYDKAKIQYFQKQDVAVTDLQIGYGDMRSHFEDTSVEFQGIYFMGRSSYIISIESIVSTRQCKMLRLNH